MSATVTLAELNPETLQDSDQTAEQQIQAAWQTYQSVERHGLEFGRVCYEWQQKLAEQGQRVKGRGVSPILDKLGISKSTAYWWISRYRATFEQLGDTHEKPSPKAEPRKPNAPVPHDGQTVQLRDRFRTHYKAFELAPSENNEYTLTLFKLTPSLVDALGKFLESQNRE